MLRSITRKNDNGGFGTGGTIAVSLRDVFERRSISDLVGVPDPIVGRNASISCGTVVKRDLPMSYELFRTVVSTDSPISRRRVLQYGGLASAVPLATYFSSGCAQSGHVGRSAVR